jgi:zinc and cadmium transporter
MLGVGLLHLLPHALMERAAAVASRGGHDHGHAATHAVIDPVIGWMLAGFLAMFFIERFFRFHHHDSPPDAGAAEDHEHGKAHEHGHEPPARAGARHRLAWGGAAIGLTLHSLIDGVALAAAVAAETGHGHDRGAALPGAAVVMAVLLHKPLDAMSLSALMAVGGRSRAARRLVNALFSLAVPVGVVLFHLGLRGAGEGSHDLVSAALAFSAGTFLCISLADLLPELQFHHHDRIKLSLALLAGLALAWLATLADPHRHDDHDHAGDAAATQRSAHDHQG